jgi:hypothetical protein
MTAGVKTVAKPVAKAAAPAAITVTSTNAITNIESKLDMLLAKLKTDEASAATYAKKYWPIAAGLAIAASRFLHL